MKKYFILILVVTFSIIAFARGNGMNGPEFKNEKFNFKILEIATKDNFIKAGVSEENYNKAYNLVKNSSSQIDKNILTIRQKELEIRKLLEDDNKNWNEIEKIVNEISKISAENRIKILKLNEEIKKYITEDQFKTVMQNLNINNKNNFRNNNMMERDKGMQRRFYQ